jgi:hypothetical protein
MEKRRYLKHPENGRVLSWSQILANRGDMIPCDVDGDQLDEDYVMPDVEPTPDRYADRGSTSTAKEVLASDANDSKLFPVIRGL